MWRRSVQRVRRRRVRRRLDVRVRHASSALSTEPTPREIQRISWRGVENASSPRVAPHASVVSARVVSARVVSARVVSARRRFRSRPIGVRDTFAFAGCSRYGRERLGGDASRSAEYPAGHHGVFDSRARRPTSNSRPRSDPPLDRSNANDVASCLFAIAHTRSVSARETAPANLAKSHAGNGANVTLALAETRAQSIHRERLVSNRASRRRRRGGEHPASRSAGPNASLSRYEPSRTARRSTSANRTPDGAANLSASAAASFGAGRLSRASSRRSASLRASRVAASACIARVTRSRSASVRSFDVATESSLRPQRSARSVDASPRRARHGRRSADATRSRSATARGVDDNVGRNPPFVSSAAFASRARSSRNRADGSQFHRRDFRREPPGSTLHPTSERFLRLESRQSRHLSSRLATDDDGGGARLEGLRTERYRRVRVERGFERARGVLLGVPRSRARRRVVSMEPPRVRILVKRLDGQSRVRDRFDGDAVPPPPPPPPPRFERRGFGRRTGRGV